MAQRRSCRQAFSPTTASAFRFSQIRVPPMIAARVALGEPVAMPAVSVCSGANRTAGDPLAKERCEIAHRSYKEPSTSCLERRGSRVVFPASTYVPSGAYESSPTFSEAYTSQLIVGLSRLDPIQLCRMQGHEEWVGQAECRGEAEESCDEKKNLPESERLDAN